MCKSFAGPNARIDPSINPFASQQIGQLGESQTAGAAATNVIGGPIKQTEVSFGKPNAGKENQTAGMSAFEGKKAPEQASVSDAMIVDQGAVANTQA